MIMVVMGAFALTATTLLAGCGGSSTASTAAPAASEPAVSEAPAASEAAVSEPAMSEAPVPEPAPADVPATVWEGTVKPADVTADGWEIVQYSFQYSTLADMAYATPKDLAEICNAPKNEMALAIAEMVKASLAAGGTSEEWTQVWETVDRNYQLMACSMAN